MQSAEYQTPSPKISISSDRVGVSSVPAGCISKKWLCFTLRPYLKRYRADVVRIFFTTERMAQCGICPDDFPRIRVFSPEATHVIISDLKKYGFIE